MDLAIVVGGTVLALVVIAVIDALAGRSVGPHDAVRGARAEVTPQRRRTVGEGLWRTRDRLARGLAEALGVGDETVFDRLEEALIGADVGVAAAHDMVDRVRREVGPGDHAAVMAALRRQMLASLRLERPIASGAGEAPYVVLVTGVNGVGKTTTVGKLAARYRDLGRTVLVVAGDTFRAAAADQLEAWATRVGVGIVRHHAGGNPAAVVFDGMAAALARGVDVVLIDTAGRMHTRGALVEELRKVRRVIGESVPEAPHATLLVLDATTGQNALNQARVFAEAVDVTGVVLTKLDGTARGGIALAIAHDLGLPITDVGVGEHEGDLRPFDAEEFVDAVLGPSASGPPSRLELQP